MKLRNIYSQGDVNTQPRIWKSYLVGFGLGLLSLSPPISAQPETVSDVRVLIDVSGSMKKNDPNNLRAPALRMLVGLMPEGTRAGVWTFGRYVNMQVKLDAVNKQWKNNAMAEAAKIHSRGLYTNIEEALKHASEGWVNPDPRFKRHIILLTDGVVDISKDKRLNEQSRRRLLNDILPKIEQADASIHTIALSKNVDTDLLNALSGATKGAFEQVDSAEQLQRVFLKLFEKSVSTDTLPIEDNKFTVDKHIEDITVLVFLAKDSPATQLLSPDGKPWSGQSHPENVSWHHEDGYDLVTIKKPEAGQWSLQAKVDPDNRVMIVSNIRLKVDKLPNTLMLGDKFDVRARLLEEGKTVTNKDLLSKTGFTLKHQVDEDKIKSIELVDDGNAPDVLKGDGVYSTNYSFHEKAGEYQLIVQAKSLTFEREKRHSIQVHDSPASIIIYQEDDGKPYEVIVRPHAGLIRPESVSMQIKLPEGEPQIIPHMGDLEWLIHVDKKFANQPFTLTLVGNRYSGESVKLKFEQLLVVSSKEQPISLKVKPEVKPESETQEQIHAPAAEEKAHEEVKEDKAKGQENTHEEGFNWIMVLILVVVVNAIVGAAGWFGYRFWKKKQAGKTDAVEKELEAEPVAEAKKK